MRRDCELLLASVVLELVQVLVERGELGQWREGFVLGSGQVEPSDALVCSHFLVRRVGTVLGGVCTELWASWAETPYA